MKSIKTAIIGIGNMGSAHAKCIYNGNIDGMVLTAVCDTNPDRLHSFAAQYPDIKVYDNACDMLEDDEIDAVIIAVPHILHAELAIKALNKGKHILVEKPIDISVSKAIELNEVAKKSDRVFSIMFNQRTNPLYIKAEEFVKSGQ